MPKIFTEEIRRFHQKLESGERFAFSRFGDGEWLAIQKKPIPEFKEWTVYQTGEPYETAHRLLVQSFTYQHSNYHVGILCTCCLGNLHTQMRRASGQPEKNLTFANLFVNANFDYYRETIIPTIGQRRVVVIANEASVPDRLPFPIAQFYPIPDNAWVSALTYIDQIDAGAHTDSVFLLSGGAFASIAVQQLWERNQSNVYLDVGSSLDFWLRPNPTHRNYLYDTTFRTRVCTWGAES